MGSGTVIDTVSSLTACDTIRTINVLVVNETSYTKLDSICSEALPYYWNGNSYSAGGTYELRLKNQYGCDSVHTLILQIIQPKSSGKLDSVCSSTLPYVFAGQNFNSSGTYSIHFASVSGCDSVATLTLVVKSSPRLIINNPLPVCAPFTVDLTAPEITAGSDPGLSFTYWNDMNLTSPLSNPSRVSQSGTYYIQTSYINECASNEPVSVVINIYEKIDGTRYPTQSTTPISPLKLSARNIGNQFSWYPGLGLDATSIPNPTFQYDRDMEYTITMKTNNNCTVVDTVLVLVQQTNRIVTAIVVPKAWTPNNDGHNDKLFPLMVNISELKSFRIFNRWGQLVFETKTIGEGWNGIYNGKLLVMDVYTWMVEAIGNDGRVYKKTGNSMLIK